MDNLQSFFASIGGAAFVLALIAFPARKMISYFFAKELEKFKSDNAMKVVESDREYQLDRLMKKYKGPLVHSSIELSRRIYNILSDKSLVNRYFTAVDSTGRIYEKDYVLYHTSYLIAQYMAWIEIIRREVQYLEFGNSSLSEEFNTVKFQIMNTFQNDSVPDNLCLWAGEQRAIGEAMITEGNNGLECIGLNDFVGLVNSEGNPYTVRLVAKVEQYCNDLIDSQAPPERLASIREGLLNLVKILDPNKEIESGYRGVSPSSSQLSSDLISS